MFHRLPERLLSLNQHRMWGVLFHSFDIAQWWVGHGQTLILSKDLKIKNVRRCNGYLQNQEHPQHPQLVADAEVNAAGPMLKQPIVVQFMFIGFVFRLSQPRWPDVWRSHMQ